MSEPLPIPVEPPRADTSRTVRRAVVRIALVNRLCATAEIPVVSIVAPAGYGKTTLLAQWAERDRRPTAWLTLGPEHNRPGALEPALGPLVDASGLLALVDDVHLVCSAEAREELEGLLARVATGTTVALAGRVEPTLPLPRLRAEGRVLEVGPDDLALHGREAQSLLRHAGVLLPEREADALEQQTEGWPAALYLAALSVRTGAPAEAFAGDDRFVADYLESEHLAQLSLAQRRFATRTSVLEDLSAEECDRLLGRRDSARMLDALDRLGLVVPLDHRRRRYRYRRLVRDLLRSELERAEPERARTLRRTAAAWCEDHGEIEEALRYTTAAGDLDRAAKLAAQIAVPACTGGRLDALTGWLETVRDRPAVERHPDLCLAGSWLYALRGRPAEAQHWADAAARALDGDDPRLAVLRALRCRDGADQMLDDTTQACSTLAPGSAWWPSAMLARGVARLLAGDPVRADADLGEASEAASAAGAGDTQVLARCAQAILAAERDLPGEADAYVEEARAVAGATAPDPSAAQFLLAAVSARAAIRHGDRERAGADAEEAAELLPYLTYALPWLSTLAALELVHVRLGLADPDGARELLRRVTEIFRVRPRLGVLVQHAAELDRRTRALAEPEGRWASSLTSAETRLLPLLATHLSFREIGEHLFVSRNTVKTQAISVYRKFGVSNRSDAIARAIDLGLIDETAFVPHRDLLSVR